MRLGGSGRAQAAVPAPAGGVGVEHDRGAVGIAELEAVELLDAHAHAAQRGAIGAGRDPQAHGLGKRRVDRRGVERVAGRRRVRRRRRRRRRSAAMSFVPPSMIVTRPLPSAIVTPPVGADSVTSKNSVGSAILLPRIVTVNVAVVWPAANVTVPVFCVKSEPAVAVPATVVAVTEIGVAAADDSVSVIVAVELLRPSVTVTSPIEIVRAAAAARRRRW